MRALIRTAAACLALCAATAAQAQPAQPAPAETPTVCFPPGGPPPQSMRPPPPAAKPVLPGCVDPRTNLGHCPKGVLDKFNASVNAFNASVVARGQQGDRYIDALNAWVRAASAYGNCEVNRMNAETP